MLSISLGGFVQLSFTNFDTGKTFLIYIEKILGVGIMSSISSFLGV